MNISTGELFRIKSGKELKELKNMFGDDLQPVPRRHEREANVELDGKANTKVDMDKKSPLVDWAKKKRKRKMSQKSKKVNRKQKK